MSYKCLPFYVLLIIMVKNVLSSFNDETYYDPESYKHTEHSIPKDSREYLKKLSEMTFTCLGKKLNDTTVLKMSTEEKLLAFKQMHCPPIIMLPGFLGTKMEFKMKNCTEFKKFHPNIMQKCGWDDCRHKSLQKFSIWINTNIDFSKILSFVFSEESNKKTIKEKIYIPHFIQRLIVNEKIIDYEHKSACFGSLFRLYFQQGDNGLQLTNLKGAEIRVMQSNKNSCGLDVVSDYLGTVFPNPRALKGFSKVDEFLSRLGYSKGLNLFYHPYDFRLPLEKLIRRVHNTVKIAYKITKKKPLIIGHSLGGLLAYKYSLQHPELLSQVISIATPFLGSFTALDGLINNKNLVHTEKTFEIFGNKVKLTAKIDDDSMKLIYTSFLSSHLLPKNPDDEDLINLLNNVKLNEDDEFSIHFNSFFPKEKCESVRKSSKHKNEVCQVNYKKFNFTKNRKSLDPSLEKIFNDIFSEYDNLLNEEVHSNFKLSLDDFIEYLKKSEEKKSYDFQQPNVPFTFLFSQHIDTPISASYEEGEKPKYDYTSGDGTVDGFSQFYPGLKWLYSNFKNKVARSNESPIHFVEYCARHNEKSLKNFHPSQTVFLTISCDCLEQTNLNTKEECSHASMLSDTNLLLFLGDVVSKSSSQPTEVEAYKDLYSTNFSRSFVCSHLE
jgi:hypothetical protein